MTVHQIESIKEKLAVGLLRASAHLPLGVARCIGAAIGRLNALLHTQMYWVTLENLELCYPEMSASERQRLAVKSLRETGKLLCETGSIWLRDYQWTADRILEVKGEAKITAALESGEGLLVLAPHIGNWEVLGLYLAKLGPIVSLYQPPDMAAFEAIIRGSREKSGAKLVPTNRRGVTELLKTLKSGGFTGILPDQVPDKNAGGAFAPFFGHPALTMTLVHSLRSRAKCRVLTAVAERVDKGFRIHVMDPDPGIYSEEESEALAGLNRSVENCIDLCPEQYQWEYKRFRKQPDQRKMYKKRR